MSKCVIFWGKGRQVYNSTQVALFLTYLRPGFLATKLLIKNVRLELPEVEPRTLLKVCIRKLHK